LQKLRFTRAGTWCGAPSEISDGAAVNFMDVCTQHVVYIVGMGLVADEIPLRWIKRKVSYNGFAL
jgi:hypothetical protein